MHLLDYLQEILVAINVMLCMYYEDFVIYRHILWLSALQLLCSILCVIQNMINVDHLLFCYIGYCCCHHSYSQSYICKYIVNIVVVECTYILLSQSGNITSPGYPGNFPAQLQCDWTIVTNPGGRIKLTFHSYDLPPKSDGRCPFGYIEYGSYSDSGDRLVQKGHHCGCQVPDAFISRGERSWVYMLSSWKHYDNLYKGFIIQYETVEAGQQLRKQAFQLQYEMQICIFLLQRIPNGLSFFFFQLMCDLNMLKNWSTI